MTQTQPVLEVTNIKVHYPVKGPLFSKKQTLKAVDGVSFSINKGEILGLVGESEKDNCKKMLTAAALTYVASVATAILEILRLVLIARRND